MYCRHGSDHSDDKIFSAPFWHPVLHADPPGQRLLAGLGEGWNSLSSLLRGIEQDPAHDSTCSTCTQHTISPTVMVQSIGQTAPRGLLVFTAYPPVIIALIIMYTDEQKLFTTKRAHIGFLSSSHAAGVSGRPQFKQNLPFSSISKAP